MAGSSACGLPRARGKVGGGRVLTLHAAGPAWQPGALGSHLDTSKKQLFKDEMVERAKTFCTPLSISESARRGGTVGASRGENGEQTLL